MSQRLCTVLKEPCLCFTYLDLVGNLQGAEELLVMSRHLVEVQIDIDTATDHFAHQ